MTEKSFYQEPDFITKKSNRLNLPDYGKLVSNQEVIRLSSDFLCNSQEPDILSFNALIRYFDDMPLENLSPNKLKTILHIAQNPTDPVQTIQEKTSTPISEILDAQKWVQTSNFMQKTMQSHYYPGYLFIGYAQSFFQDLAIHPDKIDKIKAGQLVAPNRLEIHTTNASCNYRCEMCLWHVKNQAIYTEKKETEILDTNQWKIVLEQSKKLGTDTIIFSGGGEPLLRQDFSIILNQALKLNLHTMIYTNGSNLSSLNHQTLTSILNSDWLRISLHATTNDRYSKIVNVSKDNLLEEVINGIKKLKQERDASKSKLQIGIGFVIQSQNFDQVEEIVNIGSKLGIDFINFRVDCIDVTEKLTDEQKNLLYFNLSEIRKKIDQGLFPSLKIDFADELISPMNKWSQSPKINHSSQCRVHLYRSAINPYGRVAVCDLTAEPFYSQDKFTLGFINQNKDYKQVLADSATKIFSSENCQHCMPGQKSINALWTKVLQDEKIGVKSINQPLFFKKNQ